MAKTTNDDLARSAEPVTEPSSVSTRPPSEVYRDAGLPLESEVYGFLEALDVDWSDFEVQSLARFIQGRIDDAIAKRDAIVTDLTQRIACYADEAARRIRADAALVEIKTADTLRRRALEAMTKERDELLAALKAVADDRHACGTMRHRAQEAIAKAEGR